MVSKLPMVPGVVQRFLRAAREGETPAQCKGECHVLDVPGLRLQTPTVRDVRIGHATLKWLHLLR